MNITLTDKNGIVRVSNMSMLEISKGLFTYPTSGLTYHMSYHMVAHACSSTYGLCGNYDSTVYIADSSDWNTGLTDSGDVPDSSYSLFQWDDPYFQSGGSDESFFEHVKSVSKNTQIKIFGVLPTSGTLGILYWILGNFMTMAVFMLYLFLGIIQFLSVGLWFVLSNSIDFLRLVEALMDESTRQDAISTLLSATLSFIGYILYPFLPLIVVYEVLGMAFALKHEDAVDMLSFIFSWQYKGFIYLMNAFSIVYAIFARFVSGVFGLIRMFWPF
jgi:hypothetical protein